MTVLFWLCGVLDLRDRWFGYTMPQFYITIDDALIAMVLDHNAGTGEVMIGSTSILVLAQRIRDELL
jgi:hypothetical protein